MSKIPGVFSIELAEHRDPRGVFVKPYVKEKMAELGLFFELSEEYYSISKKNVLRGMHFQTPPFDCAKLVYCPIGEILDVLVDLRRGATYGMVNSFVLSQEKPSLLVIPEGVAHGFLCRSDTALMVYKTNKPYSSQHDLGVKWSSVDFNWGIESPLVSERDCNHQNLDAFISPFAHP